MRIILAGITAMFLVGAAYSADGQLQALKGTAADGTPVTIFAAPEDLLKLGIDPVLFTGKLIFNIDDKATKAAPAVKVQPAQ